MEKSTVIEFINHPEAKLSMKRGALNLYRKMHSLEGQKVELESGLARHPERLKVSVTKLNVQVENLKQRFEKSVESFNKREEREAKKAERIAKKAAKEAAKA